MVPPFLLLSNAGGVSAAIPEPTPTSKCNAKPKSGCNLTLTVWKPDQSNPDSTHGTPARVHQVPCCLTSSPHQTLSRSCQVPMTRLIRAAYRARVRVTTAVTRWMLRGQQEDARASRRAPRPTGTLIRSATGIPTPSFTVSRSCKVDAFPVVTPNP